MNFAGIRRFFLSATLIIVISRSTIAATILLQPVSDTTLTEFAPNNNLGGTAFVNAGSSGVNANGARNRALYRFDFSSIPANSKIKSAAVTLEVAFAPGAAQSSSFALHRMLRSWGEGDKDSTGEQSPGVGLPATANEATWNSPFAFTTNTWTAPGASNDFSSTVSSRTDVYDVGDFPVFSSTAQLVADVQYWLDHPTNNFGWMLKTESEDVFFTARRFTSHEFVGEDTNSPPNLDIEFIPPPMVFGTQITNGQFRFSFPAESNAAYKVEYKNVLASTNSWLTLTNIAASPAPTNILVFDMISFATRFYRVIPQ